MRETGIRDEGNLPTGIWDEVRVWGCGIRIEGAAPRVQGCEVRVQGCVLRGQL